MNVNRRNFLKGTAIGRRRHRAGRRRADRRRARRRRRRHATSGTAGRRRRRRTRSTARTSPAILTPGPAGKQAFTCVAAFDSTAADKAGLADLLQTLTDRARFLTAGGTPPNLGVSQPPSDSDVLGPGASRRRADRDAVGRVDACSTTATASRPQAAEAQADAHLPERLARPRLAARRPAACSCAPTTRTRSTTRSGTSPSTPAAACSCAGRWRATTRRRARRAPRGTCSGSRTAPPTRPAASRPA